MSDHTDDLDERAKRAGFFLARRLEAHAMRMRARGRVMTESDVAEMEHIVKHHARECRLKGIRFPELVVLAVPEHGWFQVERRDRTREDLDVIVLNLTVTCPGITPDQAARACHRAFPHLRPRGSVNVEGRAPQRYVDAMDRARAGGAPVRI